VLCWWNIKIWCHTGHTLSVHFVRLSVHYSTVWHNNISRQRVTWTVSTVTCAHVRWSLKLNIPSIQNNVTFTWFTVQSSLQVHEPWWLECWPFMITHSTTSSVDLLYLVLTTAGLSVSFPHYPAIAHITLSSVFTKWGYWFSAPQLHCKGTVPCLTAILVLNLGESLLAATAAA